MTNFLATRQLRQFARADEGQAIVITALALVVLMLMAGLGVDVGFLRYQKQQMQKAADAAAIAGAAALEYGGGYMSAAYNDSAANGFTNGVNGVTITVNNPPKTVGDPFYLDTGYVEVIVAQVQPTFFMPVGGIQSVNVSARAVASAVNSGSACVYALDPNDDSGTLLVDGNVTIKASCGIYVDSSSPSGLLKNGASGSVLASSIAVVGGYSGRGFSPTPVTGVAPFSDPLAGVPAPAVAPGCAGPPVNNTYSPGTYCNGISIAANQTWTFIPGVYTIEGGLSVTGTPTLNGTGVLFYLTCSTPGNCAGNGGSYGGINIGGNVTLNLSAQTTGPQAGILFFQDRSVPVGSASSSFLGTSGGSFMGGLYFSTTGLEFKGTPGVTIPAVIIAWTLEFKGDAQLDETLLPGGGSPIQTAVLVE